MEKVDVAIAGTGIAGCHAARDLARLGHTVYVADRRKQEKLGHDWWDAIKEEVFDEVNLPKPQPPELLDHVERTTIYPPMETVSYVAETAPGKIHIDRIHFAQRQVKYAQEAGARMMFETSVKGPILENGRVCGMIVEDREGNRSEIRARMTIDASGMPAVLRKHIPANPFFPKVIERKDTFVTHRAIYTRKPGNNENIVVFGQNNGVRWINRGHGDLIDFFAGCLNYPGRKSPRKLVDKMRRETPDTTNELRRGGYGAPIPVRHCLDAFVYPGFAICGDSACQCNPLDGSGMAASLRSAHHAAKTIHACLENDSFEVADMWDYVLNYKRTQGALMVPFDVMQKFMISIPKPSLEQLFTRKVIVAAEFWGTGKPKKESLVARLAKLLRVADQPAFMMSLFNMANTGKALVAHFENYPEKYNEAEFEKWKTAKNEHFKKLPPVYEV